ncbi:hypothetical protein SMICM304S_08819 [Streptomyces microflavus]
MVKAPLAGAARRDLALRRTSSPSSADRAGSQQGRDLEVLVIHVLLQVINFEVVEPPNS